MNKLKRAYDTARREELHDGFYHRKEWPKLSQFVKRRDGYASGVTGKLYDDGELIVDHIVPRRLLMNRSAMLDESNLWLLNRHEHRRKTALENKIPDEKLKKVDKEFWIDILKT